MRKKRQSKTRRQAWVFCVVGACCVLPVTLRAGFTDVTSTAGVDYLQHQGQSAPDCIFDIGMFNPGAFCEPERMAGAAAVGDVDNDGHVDLYVTRIDAPGILFLNNGMGGFSDGTAAAGLDVYNVQANGAGFFDAENDGDLDLFVTVLGDTGDTGNDRNYLYFNNGSGVFTEDAVARGAAMYDPLDLRRQYSVNFGDYNRDGWTDVHVTEWLPDGPSNTRLLKNLGLASPMTRGLLTVDFEDDTVAAGAVLENVDAFASSFTDVDDDGWPDLVVAADFGSSRLFWNDGDGTFTDGTAAANVGTDENGMGSTLGDYDLDGDLDWFVTSIFDPDETCESTLCNWGYTGNRLYRYEGGRVFSDATDAAGVRNGHWGWGAAFFDYDNDGDLDLVMTNGVDFPDGTAEDVFNDDPMRLWNNDGTGVMTEVSASEGITDTGSGKGLLVFDYDDDGDLDIFVVNNASSPTLYRNDDGNANDWLRVRTIGAPSNREGLGAKISVRPSPGAPVQIREMGTSTHYLGQSERVAHFGLGPGPGPGPVASVRIRWPSGVTQGFSNIARNTTLVAMEASCVDGDGDDFCLDPDCNDGDASINPAQAETCDGIDNNCDGFVDEGLVGCLDESGGVADGGTVPGVPLTVDKAAGDDVTLTWSASCSGTDNDYVIYEGTLGTYPSHLPSYCSTGGATTSTFAPKQGDVYFLIAPRTSESEGSQGRGSDTLERNGLQSCMPRVLGSCP